MVYIHGIPRSRKPALKWVLLDFGDEFPWGAHRNRTVRWVLDHNPSYIAWLVTMGGDPTWAMQFRFTKAVKDQLERIKKLSTYKDVVPRDFYTELRPLRIVS